MQSTIRREDVKKLVGKPIYAVRKNGAVVTGLLKGIKGNELIVQLPKQKKAKTSAFIPLVLFDLLAIGTFGGFGGFGSFGYPYGGYGYPGYFW